VEKNNGVTNKSLYDYINILDPEKNVLTIENIMQDKTMIFISNEIKTKYSNLSYEEIFGDTLKGYFIQLFLDRLTVFCKTFISYISKNIKINKNIISPQFNGIITPKYNEIMKLVINIIDDINKISSNNIFNSNSNIDSLKVNKYNNIDKNIINNINRAFLFGNNTFNIYQKMFNNINYTTIYKLPHFLQWNILILTKDNSKISINIIIQTIKQYMNQLYIILKNSLSYELDGYILTKYIRNRELKYVNPDKKICLLVKEVSENITRIQICIAYEINTKKELDYIIEIILYNSYDMSSLNIIETLKYDNCIKYNIINNLPKKYFVLKLENLIKSTFDNLINKTCLNHISGYYELNMLKYIFSYKNIDKKIVDLKNLENEYNIINSIN